MLSHCHSVVLVNFRKTRLDKRKREETRTQGKTRQIKDRNLKTDWEDKKDKDQGKGNVSQAKTTQHKITQHNIAQDKTRLHPTRQDNTTQHETRPSNEREVNFQPFRSQTSCRTSSLCLSRVGNSRNGKEVRHKDRRKDKTRKKAEIKTETKTKAMQNRDTSLDTTPH